MSDKLQVTNTLTTKASELESHIQRLERALEQARIDLAHVKATILLVEAPPDGNEFPLHYNLGRLWRPKEIGKLLQEALASGPLSTPEIALYCVRKKGFNESDKHLVRSVGNRIIHVIRMQEIRGKVTRVGKAGKMGNAIVWSLV